MPKIKDYPNITEFSGNEVFLVESPDGTRNYTYEQLKTLFLGVANEVSELSHFTELSGTIGFEQIEAKKIYLVGADGAEFTDGEQMFTLNENDIVIGSPQSGVVIVCADGAHFISNKGNNDFEKSGYITQQQVDECLSTKENVLPKWRKICTDTLSDDAAEYIRTEDENGNPLNLSRARIVITVPAAAVVTSADVYLHTAIDVETDDEEYFGFVITQSRFSSTTTGKVCIIDVNNEPFLGGLVQYDVGYFDKSNGTKAINHSKAINNTFGIAFDFSSADNMDVLQICADENKTFPAGMKVELWGVDKDEN